jgi:hypothetical protein
MNPELIHFNIYFKYYPVYLSKTFPYIKITKNRYRYEIRDSNNEKIRYSCSPTIFTLLQDISNNKNIALLNLQKSTMFVRGICEEILNDNKVYLIRKD